MQKRTVLCKRNGSKFLRITFIVLAKFPRNVSEISNNISRLTARYLDDNVAKMSEVFRNFEANFRFLRNFTESNFLFFEISKQQIFKAVNH